MHTDGESSGCRRQCRGFTLLELLVVLAILVIVAGILVPSVLAQRERNSRVLCITNLWRLGVAMSNYSKENHGELPRVVYDAANHPRSYTAFTGPDSTDPFARDGAVQPNDVTASLWLLVRGGYISSEFSPVTSVFVCPSTNDTPDPLTDLYGNPCAPQQRGNFRHRSHLSYSYAMPFSDASEYRLSADTLPWDFVVMADRNPGTRAPQNVLLPKPGDGPRELSVGNSRNHRRAGQNVLLADMHVEFRATPFCGHDQDNIFTAGVPRPSTSPATLAASGPTSGPTTAQTSRALVGKDVGPAWKTDSYLIPTESD